MAWSCGNDRFKGVEAIQLPQSGNAPSSLKGVSSVSNDLALNPDYEKEAEYLTKLAKYEVLIMKWCELHAVTIPSAMAVYNCLLYGSVPRIKFKCPQCKSKYTVTGDRPIGGLIEAMECLDEAMEELEFVIVVCWQRCA